MIAAAFNELDVLFNFFRHAHWAGIVGLVVFLAILLLTILAINLLGQNYPDEPIEGRQRRSYNRLFLLNFLFLAPLFGFAVAEFRSLSQLAALSNQQITGLPWTIFLMLLNYIAMLLMQLYILFGLFKLRIELYANFRQREFEFERT